MCATISALIWRSPNYSLWYTQLRRLHTATVHKCEQNISCRYVHSNGAISGSSLREMTGRGGSQRSCRWHCSCTSRTKHGEKSHESNSIGSTHVLCDYLPITKQFNIPVPRIHQLWFELRSQMPILRIHLFTVVFWARQWCLKFSFSHNMSVRLPRFHRSL